MGFNLGRLKGNKVGINPDETGVTAKQRDILQHWTHDLETNRLVTDLAIQTTLASVYLGYYISMESGGESTFFTNHDSSTHFSPMLGGVKHQEYLENQGPDGAIAPHGRVYSPDLIEASITGLLEADPLAYVSSATLLTLPVNLSSSGFTVRIEQEILAGSTLYYEMRKNAVDGVRAYEQSLKIAVTAPAGSLLDWWFTHPVDGFAGQTYHFITTMKDPDGVITTLNFSLDSGGVTAWGINKFRTFEDKPVAFTADLHDPDKIISPDGLKNLTITDTDLKYHNGSQKIIEHDSTGTYIYSLNSTANYLKVLDSSIGFIMEGSNALHINSTQAKLSSKDGGNYIRFKNASVKIQQGGQERLWMDSGETEIRGPDKSKILFLSNTKIQLQYDTVNRVSVTALESSLHSPDTLQDIKVTDSGAFYNGSEILTVADKGVNSGIAPLDAFGLIPTIHLPSYVDDIEEHATLAALITADPQATDKIYITLDDNLTYRYSGTPGNYVVVSQSLAIGETITTAYRGDRGKIAYDHSQSDHDYSATGHSHTSADISDLAPDRIVSPDGLATLTISNTSMSYIEGIISKLSFGPVGSLITGPDGTKSILITDVAATYKNFELATVDDLHSKSLLVSPDDSKSLDLTSLGLLYNDGTSDRWDITATTTTLLSPNELVTFQVTNSGVFYDGGLLARVSELHDKSVLTSADSAKNLTITNTDLTYSDGTVTRWDVNSVSTAITSPSGLMHFYVNDTGAFVGSTQVITADIGVINNGTSADNTVPRFDLATGKVIQGSGVTISDFDILGFDNTRLETANFQVNQSEDVVIGPLTADFYVVLSLGVTNFTVRDLGSNIGTFSVRIRFLDGTDELLLTQPNDYVKLTLIGGVWYYYNFRNGIGARVST